MSGFGMIGASVGAWSAGIQHEKQKRENARNRDFEYKMWQRQNEYNLPINVRKRMEEGGFNPNMAIGNGQIAQATTAGSSTPHSSPAVTGFAEAGNTAGHIINQGAQNALNQELTIAQIAGENQDTLEAAARTGKTLQETDHEGKYFGYNIEYKTQENLKKIEEAKQAGITTSNLDATQKAQLNNLTQDYNRKVIENKNLPEITKQKITETYARIKGLQISNAYAEREKKTALAKAGQEIQQITQNTSKAEAETRLARAAALMRDNGIETHDNIGHRYIQGAKTILKSTPYRDHTKNKETRNNSKYDNYKRYTR